MKNYEKYRDLVISCILQDSVCDLAHEAYGRKSCYGRACTECREFTAEWLNRESTEIDWSKVEVDTPVLIKDKKGIMFRHFARYWRGHVYVYAGGQTSWSTDGCIRNWEERYAELAKAEDRAKYARQE